MLRVEKLRKSYGNKVAVKDIDFEVNKGEIFALLGPNGAGKTTTLKCILGLRKKDGGKIELKGKYAYLPEKKELYRYYTVKKMVEITNYYTEGFDKRKAFDLLSDFQIDLNEKIANLSHGMVTQVYLALLLSQDADIYILDEPTWGLDPVMRNRIIENSDPTAHAEILALRKAGQIIGNYRLLGCNLYVTLEPCPMCAYAMILARIEELVFATFDPKTGACGSVLNLLEERRFNHRVKVRYGLFEKEASFLLKRFFQERRK